MKLKGSFTWSEEDGGAEKGKHETIIAERDKVVGVFRQLAESAKKVQESKSRFYILHLGI